MKRTIGIVVLLTLGAGCARKVTLAPEMVHSRNDPDWVIRSQPTAAAPAAPTPAPGTPPPLEPAPSPAVVAPTP